MTERQVAELGPGTACCGWNHCGRRLAAGAVDGSVSVYDSQPSPSFKWQAHEHAIVNVVWLPPEYGDAIACACADGTLSLWEEVAADDQLPTWRKCKTFEDGNSHILNVHFGLHLGNLKMVTAYSDGQVKVYELLDSLELDKWQLQAEFQNITDPISRFGKPACTSASIAWNPRRGGSQQASFAIGFNSDSPHFNSCKFAFESHLQESVAAMARQYMRSIIASVQRITLALSSRLLPHGSSISHIPVSPEATTLARWICQSYRFHFVAELIKSADGSGCEGVLKTLWHHASAILCCSLKIWEFEEAHQRWLPLVELGSPEDKGDIVCAVAWAPNIGRPYEIIAVATCKGIAIWHIGLNTDADSGPFARNVALLNGHDGEVWQLEWDMGGMTLASTGGDGMVKLWQANLDGVWHEQAVLDCSGSHV